MYNSAQPWGKRTRLMVVEQYLIRSKRLKKVQRS
jgi:hypothetical protein